MCLGAAALHGVRRLCAVSRSSLTHFASDAKPLPPTHTLQLLNQSTSNPMTRLRVSTGSTSSPSIGPSSSSSLGHLQQARSLSPSHASPPARTTSALAAITSATAAHAQGQAAAHSQQAPPPGEVTQPRSLSGSGASQRADSGAGAGGGRPASPGSSGRPKGTLPKLGGAVLPDITSPGKRQHRLSQAGS